MNCTENTNGPKRETLDVIDAVELSDLRFKRRRYIVDGLLSTGLAVLAGSPKIGKSWMVMQLCSCVASGEEFLGMKTLRSTALYIALEDSAHRLQERLLRCCSQPSEKLIFATCCSKMGEEFFEEICTFIREHPDTRLVVIDTYQKIRNLNDKFSYANDYLETAAIKGLADQLDICILLVHHTRKLPDGDCMNEISGTNGIAGSADTIMVLKKEKRTERKAILTATGRDIEDRELQLTLNRNTCVWQSEGSSPAPVPSDPMPDTITALIAFVKKTGGFDGTVADFCQALCEHTGKQISSIALGRDMRRFRYDMEDHGIQFLSTRTAEARSIMIRYYADQDKSRC